MLLLQKGKQHCLQRNAKEKREKMTVRSVLITNGNGNLGHLLADRFENMGIRVISYDIVEPQDVPSRNIILGDIRHRTSCAQSLKTSAQKRLSIWQVFQVVLKRTRWLHGKLTPRLQSN